jgi:hypothetical protein
MHTILNIKKLVSLPEIIRDSLSFKQPIFNITVILLLKWKTATSSQYLAVNCEPIV